MFAKNMEQTTMLITIWKPGLVMTSVDGPEEPRSDFSSSRDNSEHMDTSGSSSGTDLHSSMEEKNYWTTVV